MREERRYQGDSWDEPEDPWAEVDAWDAEPEGDAEPWLDEDLLLDAEWLDNDYGDVISLKRLGL